MAKVYQPGDPRDFGEAMVYAHKLEMQRDRLREALEKIDADLEGRNFLETAALEIRPATH